MKEVINIENRLSELEFSHRKGKHYYWKYKCKYGKEVIVRKDCVKKGNTKSCGCLNNEMRIKTHTTHGKSRSKIYKNWYGMLERCKNINHEEYKNYGGRGIKVCDEWLKFENFYKDMGERPKNKTLDRKDNNGNYCKDNCRWATEKQQHSNMRSNVNIEYNGEIKTITQWAKALNINVGTLRYRLLKAKWSYQKSFNEKIKRNVK